MLPTATISSGVRAIRLKYVRLRFAISSGGSRRMAASLMMPTSVEAPPNGPAEAARRASKSVILPENARIPSSSFSHSSSVGKRRVLAHEANVFARSARSATFFLSASAPPSPSMLRTSRGAVSVPMSTPPAPWSHSLRFKSIRLLPVPRGWSRGLLARLVEPDDDELRGAGVGGGALNVAGRGDGGLGDEVRDGGAREVDGQ